MAWFQQSVQTLLFDGSYEAFRVGIHIPTTLGQLHWLRAGGLENTLEPGRMQRVAVVDQVLLAGEETSLTASGVNGTVVASRSARVRRWSLGLAIRRYS